MAGIRKVLLKEVPGKKYDTMKEACEDLGLKYGTVAVHMSRKHKEGKEQVFQPKGKSYKLVKED